MDYLMLTAIALGSGLLGFILHAVFFNKTEMIESLSESNRALREDLRRKEKNGEAARAEAVRSGELINLLERQLHHRNKELDDLYHEALRREEKIALLERTLEKVLPVPSKAKESSGASPISEQVIDSDNFRLPPDEAEPKGDFISVKDNGRQAEREEEPLWRKKLNTILDVLNEIEK